MASKYTTDVTKLNMPLLETICQWLEAGGDQCLGDIHAHFDMAHWDANVEGVCGTVCCIGGAAALLEPDKEAWRAIGFTDDYHTPYRDPKVSRALFFAKFQDGSEHWSDGSITPAWAARTLRHLMATGEVNWEACKFEIPTTENVSEKL